jgi:outer membrane protein assembly factor BamB
MICFRVEPRSGGMQAVRAWENPQLKINLATPVWKDGFLYSLGPEKNFVCVDASTGAVQWSHEGYGRGMKDYASTIAVGNRLLVLNEDGRLFLLEADAQAYREAGQMQLCGSTWSHPAYAGGRLYYRDGRELGCLRLAP